MFRKALFASFIALGAAASGTQAAEPGPELVNTGGDLEVVHGSQPGNVVGGAHATISGGGDNATYRAAPDGRTQESGLVAMLFGGGDEARLVYGQIAVAAMRFADARRR